MNWPTNHTAKVRPMLKGLPLGKDRKGWHNYYVKRFNRTLHPDCATLACWYLFLHLAEIDGDI